MRLKHRKIQKLTFLTLLFISVAKSKGEVFLSLIEFKIHTWSLPTGYIEASDFL